MLIDFEAFDPKQPAVVKKIYHSLNSEESISDFDIAVNDTIKETDSSRLFSQNFLNKFSTKGKRILPNISYTEINELIEKSIIDPQEIIDTSQESTRIAELKRSIDQFTAENSPNQSLNSLTQTSNIFWQKIKNSLSAELD
ncbi:MAG: hypothetical protein ACJARD_000438 [Alphaproteobacteria bacterium]